MQASFEGIVRDRDGRTFGVPRIELDAFHHFHLVATVNDALERLCGTPVTTLRCLASERVDDDARHRRYEFEAHGPVRGLPEVEVELPPPGNPWEAPGWFAEAEAWIRERVDGAVQQLSARSISALLRAGDTYLKASPAIFAAEPAITQALAHRHRPRVPDVLDVDAERGWLLMRDFGDERLTVSHPVTIWLEALREYADLQLAWAGRGDELLAIGCPDRTLPQLERGLGDALADLDAMLPDRPAGLSDDQIAALPVLHARLHDAAARLAALGIPPTIDHGDLHAGNIALHDGGPLVFDWSDGSLAFPLVSVTPILVWDEQPAGAGTALRDAYLERIGAPADAWEDAVVVGLAHQAVTYHLLTNALAPHSRWEWETVLPWLVKQLLER